MNNGIKILVNKPDTSEFEKLVAVLEVGKVYAFTPVEIRQLSGRGTERVCFRYGDSPVELFARPLPFQLEKGLQRTEIKCRVVKIDFESNKIYLEQDLKEIYAKLFIQGNEYPFQYNGHTRLGEDGKSRLAFVDDTWGFEHVVPIEMIDGIKRGDWLRLKVISTWHKNGLALQKLMQAGTASDSVPIVGEQCEVPVGVFSLGQESETVEFKTSVIFRAGMQGPHPEEQLPVIMRVIAGFMNKNGGTLYIGVNDSGIPVGCDNDLEYINKAAEICFHGERAKHRYPNNYDGYSRFILEAIQDYFFRSEDILGYGMKAEGKVLGGKNVLEIKVPRHEDPVFMHDDELVERVGNMTLTLHGSGITAFFKARFKVPESADQRDVGKKSPDVSIPPNMKPNKPAVSKTKTEDTDEPDWKVLTYYNDRGKRQFSIQKGEMSGKDVFMNIHIKKSQHDSRSASFIFCYENGRVSVVQEPKYILKKADGKRRADFPNTDQKLLSVFVAKPTDLIAVRTVDNEGQERIKAHLVSDLSTATQAKAKGVMIANEKMIQKAMGYWLLPYEARPSIEDLVLTKAQTTTSLGVRAQDPSYAAQAEFCSASQDMASWRA